MYTRAFDYFLPSSCIAQRPVEPRDHARLMVVDRNKHTIVHTHFYDIGQYFHADDLLVWNNSKVFKARLFGMLVSATGHILRDHQKPVEIFLVRPMENSGVWKALAKPGRHVRAKTKVIFAKDFFCDVLLKEPDGTLLVQFPDDEEIVRQKANQYGTVPLPPYIKDEKHEIDTYQTVYARHEGSVAAPTAGFHFTNDLIEKLAHKGIVFADVMLHVGLGTFLPVKTERVEDHLMHSEYVAVSDETAVAVNRAKKEERRVVAVGTTTARTLEGIALLRHNTATHQHNSNGTMEQSNNQVIQPYRGDIDIFITPGFQFHIVDALITNFHLPKSTLLMLVCAFADDTEFMLYCYKQGIEHGYRFYSFGDAMFIQ